MEFPGTQEEGFALLTAASHNCQCTPAVEGMPAEICTSHMLIKDAAILKHLVYARRIAERLRAEEFMLAHV